MTTLRSKIKSQMTETKNKLVAEKKKKLIQDKGAFTKLASTGIKDSIVKEDDDDDDDESGGDT